MLRTIAIGSTLQVQGVPVGHTLDGRLMVRDGERVYAGQAVPRWTDGASPLRRTMSSAREMQNLDAS